MIAHAQRKRVCLAALARARIEAAIAGAKAAFKTWGKTDFSTRAAAMNAFGKALEDRKGEFAKALSMEQGKPYMFAMGEVISTIKKCKHLAQIGMYYFF